MAGGNSRARAKRSLLRKRRTREENGEFSLESLAPKHSRTKSRQLRRLSEIIRNRSKFADLTNFAVVENHVPNVQCNAKPTRVTSGRYVQVNICFVISPSRCIAIFSFVFQLLSFLIGYHRPELLLKPIAHCQFSVWSNETEEIALYFLSLFLIVM